MLCVQSIGHSSWLPRLFATGNIFCIAISLLALAATPAHSQESVMTLAMASHSQLMWKNFTVSRSYFSDQPARLPAILIRRDGGLEKSTSEIKNDFPSAALLEKQPQPSHDGLVLFARKNLGLNRSMSVQAGYEQVCGNDSVLRKISPDGQEPGFACVKASFNF